MRNIALVLTLIFAFPAFADEIRKDGNAYYIDKDDNDIRDTDGTEPFIDFVRLSVPSDYTTVQSALDSDDCKKGTATPNQGCHIIVEPGTYAEKFEISDATNTANAQYSIVIEGAGSSGYGIGGTNLCAVTFTGDGSLDHSVISVDDSIGVVLRNFCIDMDTGASNDPKYGISLGGSTASNTIVKHVVIENIAIFDPGASGGYGIRLGNGGGTTSDTAYNTIRNVFMEGVRACLEVNAIQTVGNIVDILHCTNPTATIGGVSIGSAGGQINLREFYFNPGVANQTGINIRNEAVGAIFIQNPTIEWDQDNGTMINFDTTGNFGAHRATTIIGGRFQPQTTSSTRRVCIDWNRQGVLNIIGNSFESSDATWTCEFDFVNPNTVSANTSDVNWIGNDLQWAGVQTDPTVVRTQTTGVIRLAVIDDGEVFTCTGSAASATLNISSTGCSGLGTAGASTAATASANDGDTSIATTAFVQQEINGAGGNDLTCASGSCDVDTTVTLDTELAAKSSASSTDNAIARFDSTAGDIQSSSVLIDDSNNLTVPGSITTGTSGASCMMYRDTDDAGYTECFWLNGVQSCTIDADGTCDGA